MVSVFLKVKYTRKCHANINNVFYNMFQPLFYVILQSVTDYYKIFII